MTLLFKIRTGRPSMVLRYDLTITYDSGISRSYFGMQPEQPMAVWDLDQLWKEIEALKSSMLRRSAA